MSQTETSPRLSQAVNVSPVAPNEHANIPFVLGAKLQLEFDPNGASVERSENDLVFSFDDGGQITIADFFVTGGEALPVLVLPDGLEIPSADIFAALNPDMDLTTAAGPASAAAPGSGGTSYNDDAGDLIGGLDKLGSLGTDYWGRSTEVSVADLNQIPNLTIGFEDSNALLLSANSLNESQDSFTLSMRLNFSAPTDVEVFLRIDGSALFLEFLGSDDYLADLRMETGLNLELSQVGDSYFLKVTIPAGETSANIRFPMIDDHISETAESLTFSIIDTVGALGGIGQSVTVNISDDTDAAWDGLKNEDGTDDVFPSGMDAGKAGLDGPVVGLRLDPAGNQNEVDNASFVFQLELKDPHSYDSGADTYTNDYTGFGSSSKLSQDITVTIKADAGGTDTAEYGVDYQFNLDALNALDGVTAVDNGDGTITLTLSGQVDEFGTPHADAGHKVFDLSDLSSLQVIAEIINDNMTERDSETFTLMVTDTKGNESQVGSGDSATINADTPANFNGPLIALFVQDVNESSSDVEANAPEDIQQPIE